MYKAIRGAIVVENNQASEILNATTKLLKSLQEVNDLNINDIIMIFFTATADLTTAFPAKAARDMGWIDVPMMCAQEMNVQGALTQCIRVLLLVKWESTDKVKHVYLGKAKELRPDIVHSN